MKDSKEYSRLGSDPAQRNVAPDEPPTEEKDQEPKEGEFRNVEKDVNSSQSSGDKSESQQEKRIGKEDKS